MGHIIGGQRGYGWGSAWWLSQGYTAGDPAMPGGAPDDLWGGLPDEATSEAAGGVTELLARLDEVTDLTVERLAGISDEQAGLGATWAGFRVTLAFRFGRWSSHIREHAIQIEKTFDMIGHVPDERARLVRNLLAAYGRAESVVFARTGVDGAVERIAQGAAEARPPSSRPPPWRCSEQGRGGERVRFFKRTDTDPSDAIARFWEWWAGAADRVAASIEAGDPGSMVPEISANVDQLHKGLAWELSKGASSGTRSWSRRRAIRRCDPSRSTWLAAAPAADPIWEYHASRQPGTLGRLQLDGIDVGPGGLSGDRGLGRRPGAVDVRLWHPGLTGASPSTRMRASYLFLDNLLGEDSVERLVGTIDLLDDPTGGRTPTSFVPKRSSAGSGGDRYSRLDADAAERRRAHQRERGREADRPPVLPAASRRDRGVRDRALPGHERA